MKQVVFIIALYVLINILSLLFYIFSFSSDGKIDIGLPFIFIHLTSAKYDSSFPYNKLLIEPFLWDVVFLFTIVCLYSCCLKFIKRIRDREELKNEKQMMTYDAAGFHLFPFRTEKLSPFASTVHTSPPVSRIMLNV